MVWENTTFGTSESFWLQGQCQPAVPHLKKLDDRSKPMVYLGVEEGSEAYRLYDPNTRRIVVSRDVIFEEDVPWQWGAEFDEGADL